MPRGVDIYRRQGLTAGGRWQKRTLAPVLGPRRAINSIYVAVQDAEDEDEDASLWTDDCGRITLVTQAAASSPDVHDGN